MPSKLCPHSPNAHGDLRKYVEAGSPLVKLVDNFGPAAELLAINPGLLIVGRVHEDYDPNAEAHRGVLPQQAAREFVERQQEKYRLNPLVKIWEGPSEPGFGSADDPANVRAMDWYGAFEAERLRILAEMGLRGVVGNFAAGAPDLPLWTAFLPAVDAAEQFNGFLGLHEYASPWMWWLTGKYQTSNCDGRTNIPGEGDTGWFTLRYRKAYRQYLEPNGFGNAPLVITECGLAPVGTVCPGMSDGPWREHVDFWRGWDGARDPIDYWRSNPERDPERYYAEQLAWYDRELQKDTYVLGAAIVTVGAPDESRRKSDIGGTRVARFLLEHIRAQSAAASGKMVVVPPGPETAQRPAVRNLLVNASFEAGQAYFADDTRERAVPSGWSFSYLDETTPRESRQTAPWGRPVTALINSKAVTSADRARIFAGGVFCWKVAGTNAPVWVRLHQDVPGLTPGQTYRFLVNILPDLIVRRHPQTAYASDPLSSEVCLMAGSPEQTFDSGWLNLSATPAGKYTRLTLDFTAPGDLASIALEVRGRYALPMGAWYIDELSLSFVG